MNQSNDKADAQFEQFLGNLLRIGVLFAATVVGVGSIIYLIHHGEEPTNYTVFNGQPPELRDPKLIVASAAHLSGRGVIQLGVLLLIATPVTRVLMSIFGFLRARDVTYTILTLIVFGALIYGLFFDKGG